MNFSFLQKFADETKLGVKTADVAFIQLNLLQIGQLETPQRIIIYTLVGAHHRSSCS